MSRYIRRRLNRPLERHALKDTPEYAAWGNMKQRCYNPRCCSFPTHGARGITVCDRWKNSFVAFYADMGPRHSSSHSIDRYPNNDGNYEPGNCRWATSLEQSMTKRTTVLVEYQGERIPLKRATQRAGVIYQTARLRLRSGLTLQQALSPESRRPHLSPADVSAVRASGERQRVLAERYGVSPSYISLVKSGRNQ